MSNYVILNDGNDYGTKTGRIASVVQGEVGKVLLIDVQDAAGNDFSITNATSFVCRMETPAGAVTTVTGTITVSGGGISWEMSSGDVGTAGRFSVLFQFTLSGDIYKTHPVTLNIIADPAATEVQGDTNVTIPQSEATWLTAEKLATETAASGEILQSDGTNSEGSGYLSSTSLRKHNYTAVIAPTINDDTGDGYAPGSYWIDTVGLAVYFCQVATLGAAVWEDVTASGASTFLSLTDTPASYAGQTLKLARVNAGETALEFVDGATVYQPLDADLTVLAGLSSVDGNFIVGSAAGWVAESGATVRTSLGLGTLAEQSGTFSGGGTFASAGFTLTLSGNGGTLALGGFTLTVPATGTAVLLSETQTITGNKSFTGELSSPGAGVASTKLGAGAASAGTSATAIGGGATASGNFSTAIGKDAIANQTSSIAIGLGAISNIANTMVIGADGRVITHSYIGAGITTTAPIASTTITATGGTGTNIAATALHLAGGRGTGTGAGGSINLQTAPIGASGSSQNALVTAAEIDDQPTGAEETRLLLLDLSDGTLKRVVFGADGSGGAGLKLLAVAN